MHDDNISIEQLIADIHACLQEPEPPQSATAPTPKKQKSHLRKAMTVLAKVFIILLETVVLLAGALYGVMYVLAKGPSPTARNIFIRSVRETSAVGFLANLFYSEEEIAQMVGSGTVPDYVDTDSSLIQIPTKPDTDDSQPTGPVTDEWGLTDEDGDGIILEKVRGEGYSGYMMVVLDPSRVIMGSVPESYGGRG